MVKVEDLRNDLDELDVELINIITLNKGSAMRPTEIFMELCENYVNEPPCAMGTVYARLNKLANLRYHNKIAVKHLYDKAYYYYVGGES